MKTTTEIPFDVNAAIALLEGTRTSYEAQKTAIDLQIVGVQKTIKFVKENHNNPVILPMLLGVAKRLRAETNKREDNGAQVRAINQKSAPTAIAAFALSTTGHAMTAADVANFARERGIMRYARSHFLTPLDSGVKKGDYQKIGKDKYALMNAGKEKLAAAHAANGGESAVSGNGEEVKDLSIHDASVAMLRAAGGPLNTLEIAELLTKAHYGKFNRASISQALRDAKDVKVVVKGAGKRPSSWVLI